MLTAHLPEPSGVHASDIALINLQIYGDDFAAHFYNMTQPLADLCHPSHDDDPIAHDPTPALILDLHYETQAEIRALRKIVENLMQRRDRRSTGQTERRGV